MNLSVALQLAKPALQSDFNGGFPARRPGSGPDEVIEKIDEGWSNLRRDPNLGEVIWFDTVD